MKQTEFGLILMILVALAIGHLGGLTLEKFVFQPEPIQAAPPIYPIQSHLSQGPYVPPVTGGPRQPDGAFTAGASSLFTFTPAIYWGYIFNKTGATAYIKVNPDPITETVSTADWEFFVVDGGDLFFNGWCQIVNIAVYVTPTTGITLGGWSAGFIPPGS